MHTGDRVLSFLPTLPRIRPAKAVLSAATRAGVDRLIAMAPILGQTNPAGVPVVEHVMQNLIDATPPDDGGQQQPASLVRAGRPPTAARRVIHAHAFEEQARETQRVMDILRDMHGLSAAS